MVCEAIAYLHQRGIAHRDLKPEVRTWQSETERLLSIHRVYQNLLLTKDHNPVCKVTDFGLAKLTTNAVCRAPAICKIESSIDLSLSDHAKDYVRYTCISGTRSRLARQVCAWLRFCRRCLVHWRSNVRL